MTKYTARYTSRLDAGRLQGVGLGLVLGTLSTVGEPALYPINIVVAGLFVLGGYILQDAVHSGGEASE